MKIYGYPADNDDLESPLKMNEITIAADPNTLRLIASFLTHVADLMEKHGVLFGHEHFSQFTKGHVGSAPDIVISK
jgi:hypothetical protein